jgi:hypothetical protein
MECSLDFESYDDLQHLLAEGTLKPGTLPYLIARQAISFGFTSLSTRQRHIYDAIIIPALDRLAMAEGRNFWLNAA